MKYKFPALKYFHTLVKILFCKTNATLYVSLKQNNTKRTKLKPEPTLKLLFTFSNTIALATHNLLFKLRPIQSNTFITKVVEVLHL